MATVEERLARLEAGEQRRDHAVDAGLAAQAHGLSLVHADPQAIRTDVADLKGDVAELKSDMAEVKLAIGEILARLPERG